MNMLHENEFFPLGLALGDNFCDREQEQSRLLKNINSKVATLVMSPRRFGKTSLVFQVLEKNNIPYAYIDMYAEIDEEGVCNAVLNGIGTLLYGLESAPKKALRFVSDFFSGLNVSFNIKSTKVNVGFIKPQKSISALLISALQDLDEVLVKRKKKVVLFVDEFQRISEISRSMAIEGALRSVVQQVGNISFIFSGSNRHLLEGMFNDRVRPFYNLCDKIILDKIAEKSYRNFIQDKAQARWSKKITSESLDEIFNLSLRYPYYLNVLCHRLWYGEKPPIFQQVTDTWNKYVQEEKSRVIADLDLLSTNQAKMLIAIAKYGETLQPSSKEFLSVTKFSSSSALQAINKLSAADFLYLDSRGRYSVLDPVIKYLFM